MDLSAVRVRPASLFPPKLTQHLIRIIAHNPINPRAISVYRYRKANSSREHPICIVPDPADFDTLASHCRNIHGSRLCDELAGMDDEGIRQTRARVAREDEFRRAEAAGQVVVLD